MKEIKKYLLRRKKTFESLIHDTQLTNTSVYYHKLHVEIKKLDALFNLIEYCVPEFKHKKTFKALKKISQLAGNIRELQIEELSLKKYFKDNNLISYKNFLQKQNVKEQQKFYLFINESFIPKHKKLFNEVKRFIKKMDIKNVHAYLKKKENKINKILDTKDLPKSMLHELRKRLKLFYYTRKIIASKKEKKELYENDTLLKLLGQWHDKSIIAKHLKKAISSCKLNEDELLHLEKIRAKIAAAGEGLIGRINREMS
ncbi:MAG TPA: CHAD domain-containing protein [Saprospiraceae bacterium]|nr:CHAD domain-containing protein [Saprospiraceae bacterium]